MERLENHIINLQREKVEELPDFNKRIFLEEKINNILSVLILMIQKTLFSSTFEFPYFDKLLEATSNPNIITKLILLALEIIPGNDVNKERKKKLMKRMSNLFFYLVPFAKLFHHFDSDSQILLNKLKMLSTRDHSLEKVPEFLKDMVLGSLKHGEIILQIVEQNNFDFGETDYERKRIDFVSLLFQKISDSLDKEKNVSRERFIALGEASLVSFLLFCASDERLSAQILLADCFNSKNLKYNC